MKTLSELGISPAPWELMDDGVTVVCQIDREDDAWGDVCDCSGYADKANARLIAAAPDLYEALEECERKLDACDPYCNLLEKVRTALAKASGESEAGK